MTASKHSGGNPGSGKDRDKAADNTNGSGASGEGADSALEAMLRKRQMRVNPPPTPAPPAATPQSGPPDKE